MNDAGPTIAKQFVDQVLGVTIIECCCFVPNCGCVFAPCAQLQKLVNAWLVHRGFSVGILDMLMPPGVSERIHGIVSHCTAAVDAAVRGAVVSALCSSCV